MMSRRLGAGWVFSYDGWEPWISAPLNAREGGGPWNTPCVKLAMQRLANMRLNPWHDLSGGVMKEATSAETAFLSTTMALKTKSQNNSHKVLLSLQLVEKERDFFGQHGMFLGCREGVPQWRLDILEQRTMNNATHLWQRFVRKTRNEVVSCATHISKYLLAVFCVPTDLVWWRI